MRDDRQGGPRNRSRRRLTNDMMGRRNEAELQREDGNEEEKKEGRWKMG
jgi:hypothetical protein